MQSVSVWIKYLQKLEYNNDSGVVAATDEDDAVNYVFDYITKIIKQIRATLRDSRPLHHGQLKTLTIQLNNRCT